MLGDGCGAFPSKPIPAAVSPQTLNKHTQPSTLCSQYHCLLRINYLTNPHSPLHVPCVRISYAYTFYVYTYAFSVHTFLIQSLYSNLIQSLRSKLNRHAQYCDVFNFIRKVGWQKKQKVLEQKK